MTAGENRKFDRNMQFEQSSRKIGVLALSFLGASLGPLCLIAMVAFAVYSHFHGAHDHSLSFASSMVGARLIGGAKLSDLHFRTASPRDIKSMVTRSRGDRSARGFGYRRQRNEILEGQSSYRDGWYYDTVTFGAGAAFAKTAMFSTPIGVGGKALNSTNLTGQGGQVPAGETLAAKSIRISISNLAVPADFANIIANVSVQFLVRNFPIYQCTPEWFPAGNGGVTFAAAQLGTAPAGTGTVVSSSNGYPTQDAVFNLRYPYKMESQLNFTILLTPETAFNMTAASGVNPLGVGASIRVYIEGDKQQVVTS
jgi:hypothetical protein